MLVLLESAESEGLRIATSKSTVVETLKDLVEAWPIPSENFTKALQRAREVLKAEGIEVKS
jgi:hypothetical protein